MNLSIYKIQGTGIPLEGNDIDTDQIIPARYMRVITFAGIGKFAFYDRRFDEQGAPQPHPLNDFPGGSILIVNDNFGCGSSREHAPQALHDFGITALIGESFAEIFAGNCTTLGIPAVCLTHQEVQALQKAVQTNPKGEIAIDLQTKQVSYQDTHYSCTMPEPARKSLINGTWNSTETLLSNRALIQEKMKTLPYLRNFTSLS